MRDYGSHWTQGFPPHVLRDYALIADGERGGLIGPRGGIVWMCAPRRHSDAVFASLIGGVGIYAVTPVSSFVWGGYYEEGSLIWRSRRIIPESTIECREALAFPGATDRVVVLRQLIARETAAKVEVILDPRAGFGQYGLRSVSRQDEGHWTGRTGELYLRWSGAVAQAKVRRTGRTCQLEMSLTVPPGESRDLVLEISPRPFQDGPPDATRLWRATRAEWDHAGPPLDSVIAARDARQAQVVSGP